MTDKLISFARLCAWLQLEAVSFITLKFDKKWKSLQISCHIDDDVKNSATNIKGDTLRKGEIQSERERERENRQYKAGISL